jgi:hypothetical protein
LQSEAFQHVCGFATLPYILLVAQQHV